MSAGMDWNGAGRRDGCIFSQGRHALRQGALCRGKGESEISSVWNDEAFIFSFLISLQISGDEVGVGVDHVRMETLWTGPYRGRM